MNILINKKSDGLSIWFQGSARADFIKIDDIVSDVALDTLSPKKRSEVLSTMTPRIVMLSDGSKKLYLNLKLLGGMISEHEEQLCREIGIYDQNINNAQVARNILKRMPSNAFNWVAVDQVNYEFPLEQGRKVSRRIRVAPGNVQALLNFLKVIYKSNKSVNASGAVQAILGSKDEDDIKDLQVAFNKNYNFNIYVSLDHRHLHFDAIPGRVTDGAYKIKDTVSNSCVIL